jgi:fatty-acyl-CoA synthase
MRKHLLLFADLLAREDLLRRAINEEKAAARHDCGIHDGLSRSEIENCGSIIDNWQPARPIIGDRSAIINQRPLFKLMIVPLNEYDFLKRALRVYPDREAVVDGERRLTYRQFGARVNAWAHALRSLGVRHGDRVAVLATNSHRLLEAFFGAPLIGAVLMPLNFRLVPDDFAYIIDHGGARVVIAEEGLTHLIDAARDRLQSVEHYLAGADQSVSGWEDYEALLAAQPETEAEAEAVDENETSALLYTSGTTGKPKGVCLTHRNIYLNALNATIEFRLQADDVYLHTLAMFHCNGWGLPYAVTGVGARHVVVRKYEPEGFFELAARERMSFACMPPTMINLALNHPLSDEQRAQLPRAVRIGTAGSAPPLALIQAMQERLGWEVIQVYGLTETSPFLTVSKIKPEMRELPAHERVRVQTRTGYPMLGVELRVVDAEGRDVPRDDRTVGEIIARSNVVMSGYWRQPEATEAVIVGGYFHTGDMAVIDPEGYVEIVDRKKDLIISGGENISSIEVEGMLYRHPAVLEAACIAIPDEKWGEAPAALVVLKPGAAADESELIEFCRAHLAHFKCPRSVSFIDALPRTATGKIQKNLLRDKYWEGRAKRVN